MLLKILVPAALLLVFVPQFATADVPPGSPRVESLYSTWDDYYFYAGFQVNDKHVVSTNSTPTSHPQDDDDVEVFINTGSPKSTVRTPSTIQMAISAAGGASFSVGVSALVPKPKIVYTYKYGTTIDGTLNNNSDTDTGFTVELAIPWQELGQAGPPRPGTVWGFNAISRDRDSGTEPSNQFYSLSPKVTNRQDVQDPSDWSSIIFANATTPDQVSTTRRIYCPRVTNHYPLIDGKILSGEWPLASRVSFGLTPIVGAAPTLAEEPSETESPFAVPPPVTPPVEHKIATVLPTPPPTVAGPDAILLPGGISIKIVPGGLKIPTGEAAVQSPDSGAPQNPLTPNIPGGFQQPDNHVSLTGSLTLTNPAPVKLIMARYRLDYNADRAQGAIISVWNSDGSTALADQPVNGTGPWFSEFRPQWHVQQLSDLRRAGVDTALLDVTSSDGKTIRAINAVVEALKELKQQHIDYPLLGLYVTSKNVSIDRIWSHIPKEFRSTITGQPQVMPGLVVISSDASINVPSQLADGSPVANLHPGTGVSIVSPGGIDRDGVTSRDDTKTYQSAWSTADASSNSEVMINSWNDYTNASEIAASRQYGEEYADATRIATIAFNGSKEWHAKYLATSVPTVIYTKSLYAVPVRIENAGALPWRADEGYSLCTRWYKNGRLFDDSSPRVPIGIDILPGQSATVTVGITALNGFNEALEPGNYTLVLDMVQGDDRWFSYASDVPLQTDVTVTNLPGVSVSPPIGRFIDTSTPVHASLDAPLVSNVRVRNDGDGPWKPSDVTLCYKLEQWDSADNDRKLITQGEAAKLTNACQVGEIATFPVSVAMKTTPGSYILHWYLKSGSSGAAAEGTYDEGIEFTPSIDGPNFVLADIPRNTAPNKEYSALIALQNSGSVTWPKKSVRIGYRWYRLDGSGLRDDQPILTSLSEDLAPGDVDGDINAKFRTPAEPGLYSLLWDVRDADGIWASTQSSPSHADMLQAIVSVSGRGKDVPVDLAKYYNARYTSDQDGILQADTDGEGDAFPVEMVPPDQSAEVNVNPLLGPKPGQNVFSEAYYQSQPSGHDNIVYRYAAHEASHFESVRCQGQTVTVPSGKYSTVNILMFNTSTTPTPCSFGLGANNVSPALNVAPWTVLDTAQPGTVALTSPYSIRGDRALNRAVALRSFAISSVLPGNLSDIILPNTPNIQVVAITLVP